MGKVIERPRAIGLYDPRFEHDACGVGFVAKSKGGPEHSVLVKGLEAIANVTHRGAVDTDGKSGDGAGIITQIPVKLLSRELSRNLQHLPSPEDLGVGVLFMPRNDILAQANVRDTVETVLERRGLQVLGWRNVPINPSALGEIALSTKPDIKQVLIGKPAGMGHEEYERSLYLARKRIERGVEEAGIERVYIPSFSASTLVYKGLMVAPQLPEFYGDLKDPDFETAIVLFHQRYSTNTFPSWELAQPFRTLAHNGEINTLMGNQNWMRAREGQLASEVWGQAIEDLKPVVWTDGSDSSKLDNVAELLIRSGKSPAEAMMMLIPAAWENAVEMDPAIKAFYEHSSLLTEPWDGPAAISFTDGRVVGAVLDRNGLRPSRYKVDENGLVVAGSEVGIVDMPDRLVVEKGRLGPGQMLYIDTLTGVISRDSEVKAQVASAADYGEKVERTVIYLNNPQGETGLESEVVYPENLVALQRAFGFTDEDTRMVIHAMRVTGKDRVWSMGDDIPPAVLSTFERPLYAYFKQLFAQVTNPPIDSLRERSVMSLDTTLGPKPNLLEEIPEGLEVLKLAGPFLDREQMEKIEDLSEGGLASVKLDTKFDLGFGPEGITQAIAKLCAQAEGAIKSGSDLIILSDKGVSESDAPLPMLMAMGAVHHHLVEKGIRMNASLIAETGDAWDIHHLAALIGYGADAIHPYLALQTAHYQAAVEDFEERRKRFKRTGESLEQIDLEQETSGFTKGLEAEGSYLHAAELGLLKIMSKMGISTVSSYRGAQIFEALGLSDQVVNLAFKGTPSRIGGIGIREIYEDIVTRQTAAFSGLKELPDFGFVKFQRDGEYHGNNPQIVKALQEAARSGDTGAYRAYVKLVTDRPEVALRDLLEFNSPNRPISIGEVEPMEAIRRRFVSTAMSLGALSPEAHRVLAVAMNRIGARSNSGEGGEDPVNYLPDVNGDIGHNKIKQVASARFGVTGEYLAMAEELEIKMAQGSKPGEGGQLPGHKVTEMIARLRHAVPGVELISPPPHHDIYSIEDLSQLIYDLKHANPRVRVGVKLVSEAGVGTIAAGVAKGFADYILISGPDGGTGASPLSSIKNAAVPWELGLSETQQTLVLNNLRGRVKLRTDGGLKTGRDIVVAAMLGAEEYGFGTASLISIGCKMIRACHENTCATGIATQREDLRKKFTGEPEHAINYFTHLAEEVREILASLGYKKLDDVIGKPELLRRKPSEIGSRLAQVDTSKMTAVVDPNGTKPRLHDVDRNIRPDDNSLDPGLIRQAHQAIKYGREVRIKTYIDNTVRAAGTQLSYEVVRNHPKGLADGTIEVRFKGSAGQSFGAWAAKGVRLVLNGEANDYVGKGLSGGEIIITPPEDARFEPSVNVIIGNTVLYGATSGYLYAQGQAGERFAVRNSGATAVVEGVGDHGCEYMTKGTVLILGETGRNFGAGMSNGSVYVLDTKDKLKERINQDSVHLETPGTDDLETILGLIEDHFGETGSQKALDLKDRWDAIKDQFKKVVPRAIATSVPDPYSTFTGEAQVAVLYS